MHRDAYYALRVRSHIDQDVCKRFFLNDPLRENTPHTVETPCVFLRLGLLSSFFQVDVRERRSHGNFDANFGFTYVAHFFQLQHSFLDTHLYIFGAWYRRMADLVKVVGSAREYPNLWANCTTCISSQRS